ncbi:MAG: hypothetical protein AB7E13_11640 [Arcobacteraceae bacterium]
MDRKKIVSRVKNLDEDKVAVSLRLPIWLKNDLQKYSDEENISMNSLIIETMTSLLNDDCGKELRLAKELLSSAMDFIEHQIPDDQELSFIYSSCSSTEECIEATKRFDFIKGLYQKINFFLQENNS